MQHTPKIKSRFEVRVYFVAAMSYKGGHLDDTKTKTFRWLWLAELYSAWYNDMQSTWGYYYTRITMKPVVKP